MKAIIFDYGGVLCLHPPRDEVAEFAALWDLPASEFLEHFWAHRVAYDRGDLTPEEYWRRFAEAAGRPAPDGRLEEMVRRDIGFWLHLCEPMVAWAREVKRAGYRTAMLSNLPRSLGKHLVAHCDFIRHFDHLTLSYEVGAAKPDQRIYRHCLEGLGVEPREALFLDDRPENIRGARALGIAGVLFESPAQFASSDGARLGLPALDLLR